MCLPNRSIALLTQTWQSGMFRPYLQYKNVFVMAAIHLISFFFILHTLIYFNIWRLWYIFVLCCFVLYYLMLNVIAMAQNCYVCTKVFVKIIPSYFNNCCLSKVTNFNLFVFSQYYHRIYQIGTFCHHMKTTLICFLNYNLSLSPLKPLGQMESI